jgi:hypothetical protein
MNRIRVGEWVAAVGAAGLLVVLFFDWFALSLREDASKAVSGGAVQIAEVRAHDSLSGWSTLGWLMDVLLIAVIVGGFALPYMAAKRTSPAWPIGAAVLTVGIATVVWLILAIRLLSLAGDEGLVLVGVQLPAYLGLVFAFLIPVGAFFSLKDERTDSAEARDYVPPPARTAPGT